MASLNTFGGSPPKQAWLRRFFDEPYEILNGHYLSDEQRYLFGRFLQAADLLSKNKPTPFAELVKKFGWDREAALGLMFTNLIFNNVQIRWFVENLPLEKTVLREEVELKLFSLGVTKNSAQAILRSFGRLSVTAFGLVLKFGKVAYTDNRIVSLTRTKMKVMDGRVILYALYKFSELRGERQFTLSELQEETLSPAKIFGLNVEELEQFLNGLSANYSEYLNATFTHDLEKISLSVDRSTDDILKLFEV